MKFGSEPEFGEEASCPKSFPAAIPPKPIAISSDKTLPHAAAWAQYMQTVGRDGTVGIYHETYKVSRSSFECIYGNMPKFGLAKAFSHVPVTKRKDAARDRIN